MNTLEPFKFLLIAFCYSMLGWLMAIFHGVARGAPGFGLWVWLWPLYLPAVLIAKLYFQCRSDFSDWCNRQLYNFIGQPHDDTETQDQA